MNRRGFIATITALTGIVLAKIKAPAYSKTVRFTVTVPDTCPNCGALILASTTPGYDTLCMNHDCPMNEYRDFWNQSE